MSKSIKLLREQKEEYMEHLFDIIYEPCIRVYQGLYQDVMKSKEYNAKNVLKLFQHELAKIPEWNQLKVDETYQAVLSHSKCTYFPELLKTVYTLTIKIILLGIPEESRSKVRVKIPSPDSFIHRCLIHIARELWKRPYLMYHEARSLDRQNNIYHCEMIIRKKIRAVIRETIPMEWMVSQFHDMDLLSENPNDSSTSSSESEEEDESSSESGEETTPVSSSVAEEASEEESEEEEGEDDEEEGDEEEDEEDEDEEDEEEGEDDEEEDEEEEEKTPEMPLGSSPLPSDSDATEVSEVSDSDSEWEEPMNIVLSSPQKQVSFLEPVVQETHTVSMDSDISSEEESDTEVIQQEMPLHIVSSYEGLPLPATEIITIHEELRPKIEAPLPSKPAVSMIQEIKPVEPEPAQTEEPEKKLIHIHEPSKNKHRHRHKKRDAFF